MKRIVALLLCISVLSGLVVVNAKTDYTFYVVKIDAGNGQGREKAIVDNGEIFIPATDFSKYTRYEYNEKNHAFVIKGQDYKKAFKYVKIVEKEKRVIIKNKSFSLSNCFFVDNVLYLPLCQMLPILNSDIYEIKDDVIYISNNKLSLADVLYDFDLSEIYFNMSTEFMDKSSLAWWFIVPSYVLDTVVNFRYDRLDVVTHSGDYNDYKNIFSEFLAEDNTYLKAMAQEPDFLNQTVESFNEFNKTAKEMKTVYDWVEKAGKTEIGSADGGLLLESLKEYYDSKESDFDELKRFNDAWTSGKISFSDCIETLSYIYIF